MIAIIADGASITATKIMREEQKESEGVNSVKVI